MASIKHTMKNHLINDFGVQNDSGTLKFPVNTTVEGQITDLETDVAALQGKNFFAKADLALTGMPAYTYANGTLGVGATITADANGAFTDANSDGVQLQVNDRVFIRSEYAGVSDAHEGIYDVTAVGDGSNPAVFTRATDADESAEFIQNKTLYISGGDTHSGHVYAITSSSNPTMGTDAIDWEEKSETPAVGDGSIGTANLADNAVTNAKLDSATQAQLTKVDGIEAGADVTDVTNVTAAGALMDSEVTNLAQVKAFDSSDYATAAQGALADSAQQELAEGAFADGDKTKLDTVESGATADQTAAEIKTAYESNANTNAFTDADEAKLDAIEAGATLTTGGDGISITGSAASIDLAVSGQSVIVSGHSPSSAYDGTYLYSGTLGTLADFGASEVFTATGTRGVFSKAASGGGYHILVSRSTDDRWATLFSSNDPATWTNGESIAHDSAETVVGYSDQNTTQDGVTVISPNGTNISLADIAAAYMEFEDGKVLVSVKDEDDMSSDSAEHLPTQQSVKAFVEAQDDLIKAKTDFISVTQAVDLDSMESDATAAKAAVDAMTAPVIDSSATPTGTAAAEVSYQATATGYDVMWSMTDTDTTGFEIDRLDGTLSGLCPSAGSYDIDIYAFNLKTGGVSSQTVSFTIS